MESTIFGQLAVPGFCVILKKEKKRGSFTECDLWNERGTLHARTGEWKI